MCMMRDTLRFRFRSIRHNIMLNSFLIIAKTRNFLILIHNFVKKKIGIKKMALSGAAVEASLEHR